MSTHIPPSLAITVYDIRNALALLVQKYHIEFATLYRGFVADWKARQGSKIIVETNVKQLPVLPTKDVQELSDLPTPQLMGQSPQDLVPNMTTNHPDECVGTLLVHPQDVQELSSVKVAKRPTVGTLLVPSQDLQELTESPPSTLRRRITDRMNGPAPKDEDADTWAD